MHSFETLQIKNWSRVSIKIVKGSKITKKWVRETRNLHKEKNIVGLPEHSFEGDKLEIWGVWYYLWEMCRNKSLDGKDGEVDIATFYVPHNSLEHIDKIPKTFYSANVEWQVVIEANKIRKLSPDFRPLIPMLKWKDNEWIPYNSLNCHIARKALMF
jgi:hypothetical protein